MKIMFDDEDYMIVIQKGLFGLTHHPLFAKIYVVTKVGNYSIRVRGYERSFLMIVLNGLRKGGKSASEISNSFFLKEFAGAVVSGPNSAVWQVCFQLQTPDEVIQRELA